MNREPLGAWSGRQIGNYRLEERIGSGAMGEVYRARDTHLPRHVAIKVLLGNISTDPARQARLRREAAMLAVLNHPNIATIHGMEYCDGVPAIVMELVEGATLADRIALGPVPLEEAVSIAAQIADGLDAAHQRGIIHRDLKPANLKIRPDGTLKVLDFGLAKLAAGAQDVMSSPSDFTLTTDRVPPTADGLVVGTPAYMSPEHASGSYVDQRTDIWAFGCVFYEMLTGMPAFKGDTVTDTLGRIFAGSPAWDALPAHTPRHVRDMLTRCLTKDPEQRMATIQEVKGALTRTALPDLANKPRPAHQLAPPADAHASSRGAALWLVVPAAAVAVVAATAGITGWLSLRPASSVTPASLTSPAPTPAVSDDSGLRSRNQLIDLLEARAKVILTSIARERELLRRDTGRTAALQDERDLEEIADLFTELHRKHIDALQQDQLVAAYELQREIYHLLYIRSKFSLDCVTCSIGPLPFDRPPVLDSLAVTTVPRGAERLVPLPLYTPRFESPPLLDSQLVSRLVTVVRQRGTAAP